MNNSLVTKSMAILIAMSIIATAIPAYSQETNTNGGTFTEGLMEGQMMAQGNTAWVVGGFCCGIFGVAGAYLIAPSPPVQMLVGKSAEYVMGFTEGYKNESRKKNAQYAGIGFLGYLALYLMALSS